MRFVYFEFACVTITPCCITVAKSNICNLSGETVNSRLVMHSVDPSLKVLNLEALSALTDFLDKEQITNPFNLSRYFSLKMSNDRFALVFIRCKHYV